ncbi:MAG: hypothetical protein VKL39_17075 [Leptolyngbyaceae bacterium]|nr:hypothetical protein [Leptolyngbyaceae bacterium]
MNFNSLTRIGPAGLIGVAACSLLAGASLTAQRASAQTSGVNPCPSIYYEEPFDSNVVSPDGCPPNTLTRLLQGGQETTPSAYQTSPSQGEDDLYGADGVATNLPPIAVVPPMDGMVNVRLMNATNAMITYEVTGEAGRRYLQAQEEATLQNISLPATITTVRQDDGLVDINAISSEDGLLELSIEEEQELDDTQGVIRIQPDGQVFFN